MKEGYGRGYYGAGQLAPPPAHRKGKGWAKWAIALGVVGVGAVAWYMWPRKPEEDNFRGGPGEKNPRFPPPVPPPGNWGPEQGGDLSQREVYDRNYPHREDPGFRPVKEPPPVSEQARGYYRTEGVPFQPRNPGVRAYADAVAGRPLLPPVGQGIPAGQNALAQQAYEDAMVASARQLQATGNKVILAPHLAHLAPRING